MIVKRNALKARNLSSTRQLAHIFSSTFPLTAKGQNCSLHNDSRWREHWKALETMQQYFIANMKLKSYKREIFQDATLSAYILSPRSARGFGVILYHCSLLNKRRTLFVFLCCKTLQFSRVETIPSRPLFCIKFLCLLH